ncbi:hypothetical protein KXV94_006586 [Aspergillus fumigatus]|nr:hypothetical protein KXV94_006586 [Aspergillus fumigatus]
MDRRWPSDTLAGTGGDQLAGARQGPTPGRETPRRTREAPEVTSWPARAPLSAPESRAPSTGTLAATRTWPSASTDAGMARRRHPSPASELPIHPSRYTDRHTDPAADIGRARAPCRSERWAARAEGTGGQAGAGFEGRPALRARDGASDQVPLRPKQRANLRGPLCMGARANARTTPYRMGPPPARSGPGNVCTHDHGPVEVGGSMWKARAASPLVACELCAGHFFPARQAASLWASLQERGQSPIPAVVSTLERPARSVPGRVVQAVDGVRSVQQWARPIVGRWPVLIPRFPGGAAPREPPFVGVSAGSGPPTRGPYAAARQRPRGRSDGITCVRTGSEGLQWGQLDGRRRSPGAPGAVGAAGRRMSPLLDSPTYTPPLRGLVGPARSAPFARWSAGAGAHQ